MLKDMLGNEITVGCWVAFGSRKGSSAYTLIREVIEIGETDRVTYDRVGEGLDLRYVPRTVRVPCAWFRTARGPVPKDGEKGCREVLHAGSCVVVPRG
jgi:hypothetical protein